jgi:hypothetical protein
MATLADLWLARHRDPLVVVELWVPLLTFYFFVVILYSGLDFRFTYVLLMIVSLVLLHHFGLIQLVHGRRVAAQQAIEVPNFTLKKVITPMLIGIVSVSAIMIPLLILSGQGLGATNPYGSGTLFVVDVFLIAPTEELFFRWVMPQFYGGILPQILFGLSHPSVRNTLLSNPMASLLPFAYFTVFGLAFQQLVFMSQAANIRPGLRPYFGIALVIGLHGMYNFFAVLFPGSKILDQVISPFSIGLEVLVPLAGLFVVLLVARRLYSRKNSVSSSRSSDRIRISTRAHGVEPVIPVGVSNA